MTAVSIGRPGQDSYYGQEVKLQPDLTIPVSIYTDDYEDIDATGTDLREKLEYRAERRNIAIEKMLQEYPYTEDILMIDSFYLKESDSINHLIQDYRKAWKYSSQLVLGPVVWGFMRTTFTEIFHPRKSYYDSWATPELRWCPRDWKPQHDIASSQALVPLKGFYRVSSLAGCYIFPRSVWDMGCRYRVPDDLSGCEHNGFLAQVPLPKYADFNVMFERVKKYSLTKCLRCTLGNLRRTRFG